MKHLLLFLLVCHLLVTEEVKAQRFRKINLWFVIRVPEAYPATLFRPLAKLPKVTDLPRFDSLLTAYQRTIIQLEKQPSSLKRDTMLMGYLHDQIVVRMFLDMVKPPTADQSPVINPKILSLAQQLRKLAVQTDDPYYTREGYTWEEHLFFSSGKMIKAFEVAVQRAKLCDNCPSCKQAPECYTAMAQYYAEFNDTTSTDRYFRKALASVGDAKEKAHTLYEWAIVYNRQHKPQKALQTIESLYRLDQSSLKEPIVLKEKALAQLQLKQFDQALATTQQAINIRIALLRKEKQDPKVLETFIIGSYRAILAYIYLGKNDPAKAWFYANSPNVWDDLEGPPNHLLYQVHKALGNNQTALQYLEQYVLYTQQQESSNNRNILSIMQRNYEVQKVQQVANTEKLRAENLTTTRTYLLLGVGLLAVILFILWRSNQQKQRTNELLNRQKQEIDFQRSTAEQALSNLKTTQNQLIQKEKMASLGELTAGIAHEIQNPLNFVNNFSTLSVELAQEIIEEIDKAGLAESDKEYINELIGDLSQNQTRISQHGQRAAAIVKGMLEHSRMSSGEAQTTDLNALADEYLRLAYHGIKGKDNHFQCELVTDFDPTLPKVNVVVQDIGRVLLNLFNNAFYAVQQRNKKEGDTYTPTVWVTTRLSGGTASNHATNMTIMVKDNGTGIPEAIKAKVFQPFFTTKPTGEGTGLGLSLSYDIITKAHNGMLDVQSTEGEGSTFTILLPLKK